MERKRFTAYIAMIWNQDMESLAYAIRYMGPTMWSIEIQISAFYLTQKGANLIPIRFETRNVQVSFLMFMVVQVWFTDKVYTQLYVLLVFSFILQAMTLSPSSAHQRRLSPFNMLSQSLYVLCPSDLSYSA
jgi:hypothetical protein